MLPVIIAIVVAQLHCIIAILQASKTINSPTRENTIDASWHYQPLDHIAHCTFTASRGIYQVGRIINADGRIHTLICVAVCIYDHRHMLWSAQQVWQMSDRLKKGNKTKKKKKETNKTTMLLCGHYKFTKACCVCRSCGSGHACCSKCTAMPLKCAEIRNCAFPKIIKQQIVVLRILWHGLSCSMSNKVCEIGGKLLKLLIYLMRFRCQPKKFCEKSSFPRKKH